MIASMATGLVSPALPDIAASLHVSAAAAGLLVSATSAPALLATPVAGVMIGRWGRRAVLVPALLVFAGGGLAAMLCPGYPALLAARLVQGTATGVLLTLSLVLVADWAAETSLPKALGRNGAVNMASLALLPLAGSVLTAVAGWRAAFAPCLLAIPLACVVALWLPDVRSATRGGATPVLPLPRPLRSHILRSGMAMAAALACLFGVSFTVLPLRLQDHLPSAEGLRGVLIGLPLAAAFVGALTAGRLLRRWRPWTLTAIGFALFAAGFTVTATTASVWLVAVAALVYGSGFTLISVSMQTLAARLATEPCRTSLLANWGTVGRAGQAVGPAVAGLMVTQTGTGGTFLLGALLAAASAVGCTMLARVDGGSRMA
ncbi:MFS transporter [Nonomuraea sp. NPDC049637]|uniref:MFS transporter n=1 Tax=Nonomuraea sp. NPDC049637 TaxID=3154356 RepID=UPI00343E7C2A